MGRIKRERCQHGKDLALKILLKPLSLSLRQLHIVQNMNPGVSQPRQDVLFPTGVVSFRMGYQLSIDGQYLLRWRHAVGRRSACSASHLTTKGRHSNHEKLIQIRCEDRQKLHSLQEGVPPVLGFLQNPQIESQPAELAIQEMVRFIENFRSLGSGMLMLCRMIDHGGSLQTKTPKQVSTSGVNLQPTLVAHSIGQVA